MSNSDNYLLALKVSRYLKTLDYFKSAIHNNKTISDVEKFNYLKSKLVGEARSAVAGLSLSNDNYQVAVKMLSKRYDNEQEIVDLHYNQLISQQTATNKTSTLRLLLDKVDRHLRCFEVLKQNVNQGVFVSIIRSKLPEDVLIQLEIQNGTENKWTVVSLTTRIREYVVARERATKDQKGLNDKLLVRISNKF